MTAIHEAPADQQRPMMMFTLTDMIGKKAEESRETVIATTDVNNRTAVVLIVSLILTIITALIAWSVLPIGGYALLIPLAGTPLITWLVRGRSRHGLQVTYLRRTIDRLQAGQTTGLFLHCNRLYDPLEVQIRTITRGSVDVEDIPGFLPEEGREFAGVDFELAPAEESTYVPAASRTASGGLSARAIHARRSLLEVDAMQWQQMREQQDYARWYEGHIARVRAERMGLPVPGAGGAGGADTGARMEGAAA
ncbi:hypothetical protein Bequi_13420 [Brachybacterium sp. JHP9]|uniref:Uncharacterized protein n=1 Tax=Brachybacterium equifaecis TaxID=2910770 RepID=A0ABT0R357_9MICO|nr:hypothetical protein [Brachybacterium equifaecis]MCL6424364.1 hypothetical protein [Brachybacterium equifaecis]